MRCDACDFILQCRECAGLPRSEKSLLLMPMKAMTIQAETFADAWRIHQSGDLRRADQMYRRLLRTEPRSSRIWFALAQVCEADRQPIESVACFRQAPDTEPRGPEGH